MRELAKPLTIGKFYEKRSLRKERKKLIYSSLPFLSLVCFLFVVFFSLEGFTSALETDLDKFTKCYAISVSGAEEFTIFSDTYNLLVEKGSIL